MKQCSLDHFTESLKPWLDNDYIRRVSINQKGHISFLFVDGVEDTYEITDCDKGHIKKICQDLEAQGIPVKEN